MAAAIAEYPPGRSDSIELIGFSLTYDPPSTSQMTVAVSKPVNKPSTELLFKVDGMHCAACAANVQRALTSVPGVRAAAVSVTDGRAVVTGERLDSKNLTQAIRDSGYDATPIEQLASASELRSEIELRQQTNERQWKRRAIVGLSIWAPLELMHWFGPSLGIPHGPMNWIMLLGAAAVLVFAGGGFYRSAWNAALRRTTNMDTLIAIGATTAFVYSLALFIAQLTGRMHDQPMYFAEAAALLGIISLGHWMEARAAARAGSAVRELLKLQPDQAELIDGRAIPSSEVKPGDRLIIRPGARIPVDGVVVDGASDIDEAVVTGESLPVAKKLGDGVIAGSMNTTGRLVIKAEVDGRHTTVARIADLVQRAQSSKANIQRLADRVSAIFVPAVLLIALVTLIGWWLAGDWKTGVIATVTVLIISCPCALGLATPMAVMVGAGAASRRGILIKSALALETAGSATLVIFDKTGTLTVGQPVVTKITITGSERINENEMLTLAAAVESASEHPIARAIVRAASRKNLEIPPVREFAAIPGQGVRGVVDGRLVGVLRDNSATCRVEVDGTLVGTINVQDELRLDARAAVNQLHTMGLTVTLLSGDRTEAAIRVGLQVGLDEGDVIAEATPESKTGIVQELKRAKPQAAVIMVGDGINDAAALAAADLGIALASGTNIAMESADVVIPHQRVTAVAETVDIARRTLRTIKQNLFFAFFYNALAIPAAAFGLLGPYGPLIAAAAMGLSDVTVIGNALRLKRTLDQSARAHQPRANGSRSHALFMNELRRRCAGIASRLLVVFSTGMIFRR